MPYAGMHCSRTLRYNVASNDILYSLLHARRPRAVTLCWVTPYVRQCIKLENRMNKAGFPCIFKQSRMCRSSLGDSPAERRIRNKRTKASQSSGATADRSRAWAASFSAVQMSVGVSKIHTSWMSPSLFANHSDLLCPLFACLMTTRMEFFSAFHPGLLDLPRNSAT